MCDLDKCAHKSCNGERRRGRRVGRASDGFAIDGLRRLAWDTTAFT